MKKMEITLINTDNMNTKVEEALHLEKREDVLDAIMANLVQSGILLPEETSKYIEDFFHYGWNELLLILEESNRQRACDLINIH